ncbi:Ger(x)C family spore germination protein [Paenibacillus macerans]|uniref:Ger(x)C family spore germination protein n=1 Tax=Paenibacillus macerans TaxID=44252 RepID=UPI003D311ACD
MIKKGILGVILCSMLLPITGCWDAIELNRRAVVAGIGIDEMPGKERYLVSFQIIIADEISGKAGRGATPVSIYSARGRSVMEAVRRLSRKVPRLVSTAHTRVVVISEELAREGISDIVDFLDRDSDIRLTAKIYIVKKGIMAKDVTSALSPIGKITAYALAQKAEMTAGEYGANYSVEVDDVIRGMLVPNGGPTINGIEMQPDETDEARRKSNLEKADSVGLITVSNMAVFKGDQLKDWLNEEESQGLVWIKNKLKNTSIIINPDGDGDITLDVRRNKTSTKVKFKDAEHPVIQFNVTAQLSVREMDSKIDLRDPQALHGLEGQVNEEIIRKMKSAVKKAQSLNSDIFGFGEAIKRQNPKAWTQLEGKWADMFPRLEIEYHVDSIVRNSQMRDRSFKYNMKEK